MPAALLKLLLFILPFLGPTALRAGVGAAGKIPLLGKIPGAGAALGALGKRGLLSEAVGFGGGMGASMGLGSLLGLDVEGASEDDSFRQLLDQQATGPPIKSDDANFIKLLQQQQASGTLGPALQSAGVDPGRIV